MSKNQEYDWLDDPFDEKKAAAEREAAKMGSGSKVAVAIVLVIVIILVLVIVGGSALLLFSSTG